MIRISILRFSALLSGVSLGASGRDSANPSAGTWSSARIRAAWSNRARTRCGFAVTSDERAFVQLERLSPRFERVARGAAGKPLPTGGTAPEPRMFPGRARSHTARDRARANGRTRAQRSTTDPPIGTRSWIVSAQEAEPAATVLYLDLMKRCLTRTGFGEAYRPFSVSPKRRLVWPFYAAAYFALSRLGIEMMEHRPFDAEERALGRDRPVDAETMIGLARLANLQSCVEDVLRTGTAGDLIETGVWRGGAAIFMRAILAAHGDRGRCVWVADSFRGLPKPDAAQYPADAGDLHWTRIELAVSVEEVKRNFARYGLLDERVCFLEGWFKDTLPAAPIDRLAVLRLDGDLYESTMDALRALYPKLSIGGYAIVDDYGAVAACARAVEDYRHEHGITEPIRDIDGIGVYWQRQR